MNQALAKEFLNAGRFAVGKPLHSHVRGAFSPADWYWRRAVGASTDRSKYGNKVLRWYQERKMSVVPINPKADEIEGLATVRSLEELADNKSTAVSVITPGPITLAVLQSAKRLNVPYLWLQPGGCLFGGDAILKLLADHDFCYKGRTIRR